MDDRNAIISSITDHERVVRVLCEIEGHIHEALSDPKKRAAFVDPIRRETSGKRMVFGDLQQQNNFATLIREECHPALVIVGEETIDDTIEGQAVDFTQSDSVHILCDIIDGTDLLERDFSNWCSAFVAFVPKEKAIVAAYVYCKGGEHDTLYSMSFQNQGVRIARFSHVSMARSTMFRTRLKRIAFDEGVHIKNTKTLANSTICTYGQKFHNCLAIAAFLKIPEVEKVVARMSDARFHFLAGNPMMCRMIDGAVDVVFDLVGQKPHDVIPGAVIALSAGASMYDLSEKPIRPSRELKIDDLVAFLCRPADEISKVKYVIGATNKIAEEFIELCRIGGIVD